MALYQIVYLRVEQLADDRVLIGDGFVLLLQAMACCYCYQTKSTTTSSSMKRSSPVSAGFRPVNIVHDVYGGDRHSTTPVEC